MDAIIVQRLLAGVVGTGGQSHEPEVVKARIHGQRLLAGVVWDGVRWTGQSMKHEVWILSVPCFRYQNKRAPFGVLAFWYRRPDLNRHAIASTGFWSETCLRKRQTNQQYRRV